MNELAELVDDDGSCFVDGFTIGRYDFGNVYFPDRLNVAGLDLDTIGKKRQCFFHQMFYVVFTNVWCIINDPKK